MKSFKEFRDYQKRNVDFMPTSMLKESVENRLLNQEIRIILQRMPLRKRRGLLKKNLNLHKKEQPWTKKSGKSASGGLNAKGRRSYERENPGSDLKAKQEGWKPP